MSEYDDSHMLSKVLERMAAQALHLKDKIDSGLEIPSWAEYKIYNAYSGLGSALGTAYPGEYEEKMAADWSQYDVDDVHAAGRIAENHITDDPSELAKKIHAGLLKDPTHPKHAPSMVPFGVVGGGALGAGLGYPLSFIPKMRYAPAVTGAAGALLGGLTGHKVTKDLRGAEGDRIHQEALATQKRRLASSALMSQLSRDVAEDYLRSTDNLMDKESAATFSKSMDRHPALKGKQSQLPDKVQAGIIKKKLRMRKQAASTESQVLKALSIEGGAAGMGALKKRVKEDDLQSAIKSLIASGKVRRHPDGDLIKESAAFNDIFDTGRKKNQEFLSHNKGLTSQQKRKYRRETLKTMKALPTVKLESGRSMPDYRQWSVHPPSHYGIGKEAAATATKTDPAKWEAAKREAKNKMGGKHSARAMQLATQIYKKKGGGYSGAKPTSKNNSLKKWTKQKWNWSGGDKPGPGGKGVYLPERKADRLKKTESGRKSLAAASRKKSEATRKGQQYSSHGLAKGTSLKAKK
jgi:hypothetical protein